ncbi:MAG: glycosyltransferase family 9 protein, partial [Maricaulaceae bacterium]|jgi:ADP-heptose:LPS heptosyltransferase
VLEWDSQADLDDVAKVAQRVKSEKFSRIYDLERAEPSEKLFAATKPFPPAWCGAARGMKFRHEFDPAEHRLTALSRQLAMAGIKADPEEKPNARWAKTARSNAPSLKPEFFGLERPYVLIAPASPAKGDAPPRWPIARFAGLAARLAANGVGVGVVTDPGDRGPGRAVAQAAPDARDLSRADLTQIASLAVESAGCLGHADSGVVHLMAAAGAPSVVIARTMDEGLRIGPVGDAVITLAAPDPTQTTVEYAAQLISMYMHVGKLERRAKEEDGGGPQDDGGNADAPSTEDEEAS